MIMSETFLNTLPVNRDYNWLFNAVYAFGPDHVGIVYYDNGFDFVSEAMGFGIKSSGSQEHLVLGKHYLPDARANLLSSYKVNLLPIDKDCQRIFGTKTYYTSDLKSLIQESSDRSLRTQYRRKFYLVALNSDNVPITNIQLCNGRDPLWSYEKRAELESAYLATLVKEKA